MEFTAKIIALHFRMLVDCGAVGLVVLLMWGVCWTGTQCCHHGAILKAVGFNFEAFWWQNPHILGVWGRLGDHLEPHGHPGGMRSPKSGQKGLRVPPPRESAERPKIAKIWQESRPEGAKEGSGGVPRACPILDAFLDRSREALEAEN